ncbi:protein phosphatase 5, partial [Pseudohyphozyma bogoriensis]
MTASTDAPPPSLFSSDSDSPTAALPALKDLTMRDASDSDDSSSVGSSASSEYVAPLSGHAPDPSIDGTSVDGEGGALRAERPEDVSDEEKAAALKIKSEANALFSASKYGPSLDLYTASLNKNPFDPVVWSNRAAVRLKLEEHGLAIADATRAIELDPRFVKAYYRRALANLAIMKPKAALVDFRKVLQLEPKNGPAKAQLDATQKLLRRLQFEAAISSKDEVPTSEKIKQQLADGASPIENDYAGPRLAEDGKPTKDFVEDVIEWFKEGKVIPRRLAWQIVLGAYEALLNESSMNETTIPEGQTIDVIGDTHGQYYDFMHLLSLTDKPSETHSLLFNGDFVDRGSWSTEIVLILFAYKWLYPRNVFLNRGNHETADMNK